ncbi:hypothetical protein, partial [Winogradskyella sp.]|uniref:hypothetical protein n=1 Tax=Winogradskyella sp. TaxID=1883156 RepID=UPI00260C2D36
YIRLKFPHLRIREIRNLFGREDAWLELKKTLDIEVDDNEIAIDKEDDVDDIADDLDDIEEELAQDNELLTNAQIQKDLMEEKNWINLVKHELKSRYQDAKEQEQIQKDTEQPELLAKRALKNINAIPHDEQALVKVEMDDLLSEIIKSTNELRKISKKVRNH